jgi:hypothetical protein
MQKVFFVGCDLREVTFERVDLTEFEFAGNDLRATNFRYTTGLNTEEIIKINAVSRETIFHQDLENIDESLLHSADEKISLKLLSDKIKKYHLEIGGSHGMYEDHIQRGVRSDLSDKDDSFCRYCIDD